jgi:hypothetical protein
VRAASVCEEDGGLMTENNMNEFLQRMEAELLAQAESKSSLAFREVYGLRKSLGSETDRGCALMAAAYIDSLLGKLLEAYLIEDAALVPALFGAYGPLGTFASRTDLAYGLGLINKQTRKQITHIRKIRVEFAHTYEPITFEYPPIRDRCRELTLSEKVDTPRKRFTLPAHCLISSHQNLR